MRLELHYVIRKMRIKLSRILEDTLMVFLCGVIKVTSCNMDMVDGDRVRSRYTRAYTEKIESFPITSFVINRIHKSQLILDKST